MKAEKPLLSVIVPVFNAADYIGEALESIRRQRYAPMEIIIIDDGSTDSSAQVIKKFSRSNQLDLKYFHQSNAGPAAARNRGLKIAKGEIIAFLDADDIWPDAAIRNSIEVLLNGDFQLVVGCTQQVRAGIEDGTGSTLQAFGMVWMAFSLCAAIFRGEVFESVGRFDEKLRYGEDVDWFLRARETGVNIGIRDEVTLLYRKHDQNMTLDTGQSNHYFLSALHKSLSRRRQAHGEARNLSGVAALAGRNLSDFQTPGKVKKRKEQDV